MEICNGVYSVGAVDWNMRSFHGHTYTTKRGTSYNSYLIVDEKVAFIDTVYAPFTEELTAQSIYNYLKSCKIVELSASGEQKLKLTTPTDEQIQLTKILADKSLLEEEGIQQLLPTPTGGK